MSIISSYQARLESPRIKPEERPEIRARTQGEAQKSGLLRPWQREHRPRCVCWEAKEEDREK